MRLIYSQKAEAIESYDEEIKSPSVTWKMPAVIRLKKPLSRMKKGVRFSRINVFTRDSFVCAYCHKRKSMRELNYDHVVPRAQGGRTVWDNVTTSCYECNTRKANRTPEQAGMRLRQKPFKPKALPHSYLALNQKTIPEIWKPYLGSNEVHEDRDGIFLLTGSSGAAE